MNAGPRRGNSRHSSPDIPGVAVRLVNWNGWPWMQAAGYRLAGGPASRVDHKEKTSKEDSGPKADYYELASGLIYCRKHFSSMRVLTVTLVKLALKGLDRLRRRQWERLPLLVRVCRDGFRQRVRAV